MPYDIVARSGVNGSGPGWEGWEGPVRRRRSVRDLSLDLAMSSDGASVHWRMT